jgi:sugar lactone lactonase YvrE
MTILRFSSYATRIRDALLLIAAIGTLVGTTACGSGSTAPKTGGGGLTVTITAPTGVTPNVTVTGPDGYTKALTATATLSGLTPGSYVVAAASVTTTNAIVGILIAATVSGSPATVAASGNAAAATVTYSQRPGSGGLWIANLGASKSAVQYTAAQLASTTSAAAATTIGTGTDENMGAAFDANGNLWLTHFGANTVAEYSASQLNASGAPTPAVTLSANAESLSDPAGLAFDSSGNLWIVNASTATVVEFTASQLASTGSPTPAVTISASSASLDEPIGIAFDASGNLWVSNIGGSIVAFTPSQVAASGAPTPTVILTAAAGSINGPLMIAFDASGKLWVANGDHGQNTVVAFSPSQLTTTGSPTPVVTLSANAGSLNGPAGLAFDASGSLWVSNLDGTSPTVVGFTASQIATSGSPTPNVTVTSSSLSEPFGLAFDPHAASLPIKP